MFASSVLIAGFSSFPFVHQSQLQRWQRRPRPAFVSQEPQRLFSSKSNRPSYYGFGFRLLHPIKFLATFSSSESDANSKENESSSYTRRPRLEPKGSVFAISRRNLYSSNETSLEGGNNVENNVFSNNPASSSPIEGLLPSKDFNLFCRIHCTITLLRKHFPTFLDLPALSSTTAQSIYDPNVTVTGPKGEEFAVGLDEVLFLSKALASAATAAKRAGSLFDVAVRAPTGSSSSGIKGKVECEMLIDPTEPLKAMVLWRTRLPAIGSFFEKDKSKKPGDHPSSSMYAEFSGRSTVDLCPDNGLVTNLQIKQVKINGVTIKESLGTALAAVRRASQSSLATSSIFYNDRGRGHSGERKSSANTLLDGFLNGIQDVVDAVDALPSTDDKDGTSDAMMYVVPRSLWERAMFPIEEATLCLNVTSNEVIDENAILNHAEKEMSDQHPTYLPEKIDEYSNGGQIPLAGSQGFAEYGITNTALQNFAKNGLHQLAGLSTIDLGERMNVVISTEKVRSLFTTNAELIRLDSTSANKQNDHMALLRGAGKISDLYRSLAIFREASGGDWKLKNLEADIASRRLVVCWLSESPIQIEGTDIFCFEAPSLASSDRLPLCSDGEKDQLVSRCIHYFNVEDENKIPLKIDRIENVQLTVAGVTTDSVWAKAFVSSVLRSGVIDSTPLPDATITELLSALMRKKPATKKPTIKSEMPKDSSMPTLDATAALSFYGILRALHHDLANIANTASLSSTPAGEFLSNNVELRGLVDEVLVRGCKNYRRLLSAFVSSLRTAMQTNAVSLATKPHLTTEVTAKGSIKVNLILALWVAPNLPSLAAVVGQTKENSNHGFGVPLKIEVISEYVTDGLGEICEHRILETRLNGVLTPADMFSIWIKGLTKENDDNSKLPSTIESFMDAITWVRSMQKHT